MTRGLRFAVVLCVTVTYACGSNEARVEDSIAAQFAGDRAMASRLCGRDVRGLGPVAVSNVRLGSSARDGSGSANVAAMPLEAAHTLDAVPSSRCEATVTFDYLDAPRWRRRGRPLGDSLQVYNVAIGGIPATLGVDAVAAASNQAAGTASSTTLTVPGTFTGTLDHGDATLGDARVHDDWTIRLVAGTTVTIVVRAVATPSGGSLDMYTTLLSGGLEVTHDDDSAGSLNSRIVFTPPSSGDYVVRVSNYGSAFASGAYVIETLAGAHNEAH